MAIEIKSGDILTPEQLQNHIKVYAGPGAGKTHFLVENVKNIISTHSIVSKSRYRKVLCITYTNAAVDEIKRRLDRYSDSVDVYTIHKFIIENIIYPFQQDLREVIYEDFRIKINGTDKITSQIEGLGILHGIDREKIYQYINNELMESDEISYSKMLMGNVQVNNIAYIESDKKELAASRSISEKHKVPIKKYVWNEVRKLTHDEILYFGYRILSRNSTALYATRVKFPFIFVDEFQDTNPLQTIIIKLLGEKSTIIGIIGDVAQSIYSFQGAKPSQFRGFNILSTKNLVEYQINGNRRSTQNIVNFCNFLRQSDTLKQSSIKLYKSEEEKATIEQLKIHFMLGDSPSIKSTVKEVIQNGGVVLTRTWIAAFSYIQDIDDDQVTLLRNIYNSYFNSPIDIRSEIAEHSNVTWVRAFKFIFMLWEAFNNSSFIDVIKALSLYIEIDKHKMTPRVILIIKSILIELFKDLSNSSLAVDVINQFQMKIHDVKYIELLSSVLGQEFQIPVFEDLDNEQLKESVSKLNWYTSYKLFTEVFTNESRYMTVHQAKGLEWDKVIASVVPGRRADNGANLSQIYTNPKILEENPSEEFTRIYYVACSRAKKDLYIHLPGEFDKDFVSTAINAYTKATGLCIEYEFI